MRLITLDKIKLILENKSAVLAAVKQGFILNAYGQIKLQPPTQILFGVTPETIAGDCHIKTASSESLPYFCIKVATGFYENPSKGLPVNNGLVMLLSSETGRPLVLFQDQGHLTSIRTAAAGALAAQLVKPDAQMTLGIIGTGHQAELQAEWISQTRPLSKIVFWGRSPDKAIALKKKLQKLDVQIDISESISSLCDTSDIIVTTTPSTSPLIFAEHIKPGHHIIALGSDSPGKIELDPHILKSADIILTDDHAQCLHHGEFGQAVASGLISEESDTPFGLALETTPQHLDITDESLSIIDLTGLAAQDLALASLLYKALL